MWTSNPYPEIDAFLERMIDAKKITLRYRNVVMDRWFDILKIVPDATQPIVLLCEDGAIRFTWHGEHRYFDATILDDGRIEWFGANKDAAVPNKDSCGGTDDGGSDNDFATASPFLIAAATEAR